MFVHARQLFAVFSFANSARTHYVVSEADQPFITKWAPLYCTRDRIETRHGELDPHLMRRPFVFRTENTSVVPNNNQSIRSPMTKKRTTNKKGNTVTDRLVVCDPVFRTFLSNFGFVHSFISPLILSSRKPYPPPCFACWGAITSSIVLLSCAVLGKFEPKVGGSDIRMLSGTHRTERK